MFDAGHGRKLTPPGRRPEPSLDARPGGTHSRRQNGGLGNQAAQRQARGNVPGRKLSVARTDDPAEIAADRFADSLMRPGILGSPSAPGDGAARIRRKPTSNPPAEASMTDAFEARSGRPLDSGTRAFFEPRLGMALDGVRVHDDAATAETAAGVGALAFTTGSDIGFAAGRFAPNTEAGGKLLAHEIAHVAQNAAAPGGAALVRRQTADPGAVPASLSPAPAAPGPATLGASPETAAQNVAPPVYWGLDTNSQPRQYYLSVLPPGRPLGEIATFLYGSEAGMADLQAANPGLPDMVPGGTVVHLGAGALSAAAQANLGNALKTGLLLRTPGVPDSEAAAPNAMMHHLTIAGQTYDLLDAQYAALRRGLAWHLGIEADHLKGLCEVYLDTRNDHVENTNGLIRGISDWRGDVSVPDESVYTGPMAQAQTIIDELAAGEPSVDKIIAASQELRTVADGYAAGKAAWQTYITGTIEGASKTVGTLETVRNACFAIEAGLAGAVVAPVAFAAAGSGLAVAGIGGTTATVLATGGAITAGAVAGGTLRGSLEVALPGAQADRPASERFARGFKSGAVAGGLGAAGALAAPAVSGAIAPQLGIAEGVAPTVAQRVGLNIATGAAIGAPAGAIGTGIDHAGDVISGRMTVLEYLGTVALGGGTGALEGGAFGALPIEGLYRSGGTKIPFSGEPVMPRWMMAGPFSPLQANWSPPPEFNALAPDNLPEIPIPGYGWARIDGVWEPINLTGPGRAALTLVKYGPDAAGRTNYNILYGDRLVQSSAVTRARGATYPPGNRGDMPFGSADFIDTTGQAWVPGHNVDYADTIDAPGTLDSNADPSNYTPEPRWWGLWPRNSLVNSVVRPGGGGYRQLNYYGATPLRTVSGTPIPDYVYFIQTDPTGAPARAWRVPFNIQNGPTTLALFNPRFEIPLADLPAGLLMDTVPVPIAGAAAGGGSQRSSSRRK